MLDKNEITFITFLLYQLAEAWHMSPSGVYKKLSEANAIDGYILPCYDTLHTLGSKYLVEDITVLMEERGVAI
ncbi:MAG: DUF3791 domain-containing protein [Lachnospiraceae bacterium]|nr:DUF3791 domain-containing protein [Lachnospiraceae bacterium]